MTTSPPAVILVDPVRQHGKPFKTAVRELGYSVVSLYTNEFLASPDGHADGDDLSFYSADPLEAERLITASGVDARAVVPCLEPAVHLTDVLAHRLGLPGNDHTLARARRDKSVMRAHAADAGVRIPEFRLVHSADDIAAAAREVGFPVIVKPTMGAGSQGVCVYSTAADLEGREPPAAHDIYHEPVRAWLVERYVRGREFAVNFFSADGEHRFVDMWEYRRPDDSDYDFPLWDIVQAGPDHADRARVEEYTRSVLDAFGIRRGPSHTEVKCTPDGVYLIEVGARLSGGPAVDLWTAHGGLRPFHDTIACYLGQRPALFDRPAGFPVRLGSVVVHNEQGPGTLVAVHGAEQAAALPGVDNVELGYAPGEYVPATNDNVSIPFSATVHGADPEAVLATLAAIRSLVRVETRPDLPQHVTDVTTAAH
ncbi:ATP-grasp domain-containing protein [Streptomyces sp. NBC_00178]|uniref:ATP-grasp domain-containing protein n=1 Tax=Streptomyces sp. NBC_00178 TaxID=2975672 RepID=UPI002E2992F6|nr:ATP-grasp domain-containing protein [Streptomyces sp. NBC_00178]